MQGVGGQDVLKNFNRLFWAHSLTYSRINLSNRGIRKLTGDETQYWPPGLARLFLSSEKNSMRSLSARSKPVVGVG